MSLLCVYVCVAISRALTRRAEATGNTILHIVQVLQNRSTRSSSAVHMTKDPEWQEQKIVGNESTETKMKRSPYFIKFIMSYSSRRMKSLSLILTNTESQS